MYKEPTSPVVNTPNVIMTDSNTSLLDKENQRKDILLLKTSEFKNRKQILKEKKITAETREA
jgi:hypothetical protein